MSGDPTAGAGTVLAAEAAAKTRAPSPAAHDARRGGATHDAPAGAGAPVATPWAERVAVANRATAEAGRWRQNRTFDTCGVAGTITGTGRAVISFAGNDYLGLSTHPAVVTAAHAALDRWGAGAGASRLVTGSRPVHDELEAALARWKATERALLFPTGFAANLGVLSALATAGSRVVSDELNHASIVDGCRLARAEVDVFPHGDLGAAEHLLAIAAAERRPSLLVTDTVFSMDGDVADVGGLAVLSRRYGALLVLDEAHAVLGPALGPDVFDGVDVVRVGTLSKTLGALGGFVAASGPVVDRLINAARPYIFSTALAPADTAAALAALGVVCSAEGDGLRQRLRSHVDHVRPDHPSPIVPVVLGTEERAVAAAERLLAEGLLVPPIRPPTVAPGTSRLRVTLSAAHTAAQVDALVDALAQLETPS